MILYCNTREHTIENDKGEEVSIDNAKAFCKAGEVEDCNLALQRLESFGWDWDRLDQFYADCDNAR